MSIENIVFEKEDSFQDTATKTLLIHAGTSELKSQMKKLKVDYTKTQRGVFVVYILKHPSFGKVEIKL